MKPSSKDEPARIRLILLDDHLLFRESLARLLTAEQDFLVVAQCASFSEALKAVKAEEVDVVLVDLGIAKEFIAGAQKVRYRGKSLVVARTLDATDCGFRRRRTLIPKGTRTAFRAEGEQLSERSDAGTSIVEQVFVFVKENLSGA